MKREKLSRRQFVKLTGSLGLTTFGLPPLLTMLEGCSADGTKTPTNTREGSTVLNIPDPTPPFWGLWSVRREDLADVYCAGFDGVRPAYGTDDNYATTHEYAQAAETIGFKKLIFDAGLRWNWGIYGGNVSAITSAITTHFQQIKNNVQTIACYPYFDEIDLFGRRYEPDIGIQGCHDDTYNPSTGRYDFDREYNPDFGNILTECSDVQSANAIVSHAAAEASRILGTSLIMATVPLDIIYACDVTSFPCTNIPVSQRDNWPAYHYNQHAPILMSSAYDTPTTMSNLLNAMGYNYAGKQISQIINFFDSEHGCRNGCSVNDIKNQINVNANFTSEHWFYEGRWVNTSLTVNGVNSLTQWQNLLQAIQFFGVPSRGPCI